MVMTPQHRYPARAGWVVFALIGALGPVVPLRANPAIEREIRSVLAGVPHAGTAVGVCVVDLASGATVFEEHADEPLIPASNMKVFTMAGAIAVLGREFAFETTLATNGSDVFLIGDGDPALGDEKIYRRRGASITADFEHWADTLIEDGLGVIPGDMVIDESIFDQQRVHPTWEESDLDNWYAAPVGGLNFNNNCVDITVSPARARGDLALVSIRPQNSLVKIVNKCRSGAKKKPILHHPHDGFEYRISGGCTEEWPFGPVAFPDPGLLAADSLRTVLLRKGITVDGRIRRERVRLEDGSLPASLDVIGVHRTGLADVLRRTGKDSQNLFSECLLKRTGYAWAMGRGLSGPQGSWDLGGRAVTDTLERAGIDVTGLAVVDGSGLSRKNRCTARQLTATLAWMHAQPGAELFIDSLSIAGVDGSLRKRLKDLPGRVYGKTGTMRGLRSLSGYVNGVGQPRYAFAIIFNGYKGPSTPYKKIQDGICRVLLSAGTFTERGH